MSPMEEWWLFLSDRGIPLGTEDQFCRPALSTFFFDLSFQYDSFHSSTWKNMLRVIPAACTVKSITIRIKQGSISCPNTDDKETHTNSVPDFHYLWKWHSKYIQDRQVIPKEPRPPSARTGWDWNKSSGDPKLGQLGRHSKQIMAWRATSSRTNPTAQSLSGPQEITSPQPLFFGDGQHRSSQILRMLLPLYAVMGSVSTYLRASCWNNPSQHRPATYPLTKCSDSWLSVELLMSSYEEDLGISIWWVWLLSLRLNQMHLRLPCLNHLVPSGPSGYISWTIQCPLSLGDNLLLLPKDEPYDLMHVFQLCLLRFPDFFQRFLFCPQITFCAPNS